MSKLTKFALSGAIALSGLAMTALAKPALAVSDVFGTFANSGTVVSGSPFIQLFVPKGRYAIIAKTGLDQDSGLTTFTVNCTLAAGFDNDFNQVRLESTGTSKIDNMVVPFEVTHEFLSTVTSSNQIKISCTHSSPKLSFRHAKILAIRLDGLRCNKPSPGFCP